MTQVRIQASQVVPNDAPDNYEGQITFTPLEFATALFEEVPPTKWAVFRNDGEDQTVELVGTVPYLITISGDRVDRFRVTIVPTSGEVVPYESLKIVRPATVRSDSLREAAFVATLRTFGTLSGAGVGLDDVEGLVPFLESLETDIESKASATHSHTTDQVTGLQTALDAKAPTSHPHTVDQITGLQADLDAKAPTTHSHTVAQVTGLQTLIDAKAPTTHSHTVAQITGLQTIIDDLTARLEALETPEEPEA